MKILSLSELPILTVAANDEAEPPSRWDAYFSLGAWPQFGLIPELLTPPAFIEGNTP
jgi:hypothetical protein